jgi:alpha-acetolactate decarboxylase
MSKSIPNDIYQFSLRSAYNAGLRDGGPPVAFLTNHGTHGIGIFEELEDEPQPYDMIQVDSVAYSLDSEGTAERADKEDQMPFVMVTVFQPQQRVKPPAGTGSKKVKELFEGKAKNTPLPFGITGHFKYINTQQQTYWDVKGVIFGYCIPTWQKEVSGEGLQSCFLEESKAKGGRVLDFETGEGAVLEFAKCGRFHLGFPQDEEYEQLRI